jgi:hypothetical protein
MVVTLGAWFYRAASWFLEAGIGVLAWRRPDPTASVSLWRRATVDVLGRLAFAFVRIGNVLS